MLRRAARHLVPTKIARRTSSRKLAAGRSEFGNLSMAQSFERVYAQRLWGGEGQPSSGSGSAEVLAAPYAKMVHAVIESEKARSVADLGCGDFSVGRLIACDGIEYIGVDIVDSIIQRNRASHSSAHVRFVRRDLATEDPPLADVGLLRQVLQHLSNDEILAVLSRCTRYELILVTEHIPQGRGWVPNLNKPHGPDIRLFDGSGVMLEAPPFSLPVRELQTLPHGGNLGGCLRTVALRGQDVEEHLVTA